MEAEQFQSNISVEEMEIDFVNEVIDDSFNKEFENSENVDDLITCDSEKENSLNISTTQGMTRTQKLSGFSIKAFFQN